MNLTEGTRQVIWVIFIWFQEYLETTQRVPRTCGRVQTVSVMQLKAKMRQYVHKTAQVRPSQILEHKAPANMDSHHFILCSLWLKRSLLSVVMNEASGTESRLATEPVTATLRNASVRRMTLRVSSLNLTRLDCLTNTDCNVLKITPLAP